MRQKRKSGCLGAIVVMVIMICLVVLAGRFLLTKVLKKKTEKDEEAQWETVSEQKEGLMAEELSGKFYYAKLSVEEQEAYRGIAAGVKERADEIRVNYSDGNEANELFQYILLDFPEIFWCEGGVESTAYQEAEPYVILKPAYLYDMEETEQKKTEVEAAA